MNNQTMQLFYAILCGLLAFGSILFWVDRFCVWVDKDIKFLSNKLIIILGFFNLITILLFVIFFKIWNERLSTPVKYVPVTEQFYKIDKN